MIYDFYKKIYEKQAAFYRAHPTAKKALEIGNHALTAAVFVAYALLCLLRLLRNPEGADALRILGVPLLCLICVTLLRKLINRRRPYEREDIQPILDKKKKGQSFPSRHVASAFVIGVVLLRYCIPGGVLVLIAGSLLGWLRFSAGLHYPSDLFAGAVFGALFGLLAFCKPF